jgi:hypothetical protein
MPRERNSAAEVVKIIRIFISILKEVQKWKIHPENRIPLSISGLYQISPKKMC